MNLNNNFTIENNKCEQTHLQTTSTHIESCCLFFFLFAQNIDLVDISLLLTSDAADDLLCVDLGGRRII